MPVKYSIVIPAFNEEVFLPRTLSYLQQSMRKIKERGEIIVVDNNSTDQTAVIAKEHGARVVFEAINQISRARNAGARVAQGKYLIFLDADTLLDEKLIRLALDALDSGLCCGGGTEVSLDNQLQRWSQFLLNFWNWVSRKFNLAAGCFVFCLREAFEAAGGFNEQVYASEEIWLSRALKAWGKQHDMRFQIIRDNPIVTSGRKLDWYTPGKIILFSLPILIFPPLLRVQYFCRPWYIRPDNMPGKKIID